MAERELLLKRARNLKDGGHPVDAVAYYSEAATLCITESDYAGAGECYEETAYCYEIDGRLKDASEWYRKAAEMYGTAKDNEKARRATGAANSLNPGEDREH